MSPSSAFDLTGSGCVVILSASAWHCRAEHGRRQSMSPSLSAGSLSLYLFHSARMAVSLFGIFHLTASDITQNVALSAVPPSVASVLMGLKKKLRDSLLSFQHFISVGNCWPLPSPE